MQEKPRHYYRYQMTYPYESNKVYKSRSLNKVAKKCSNEFQKLNDMNEGMFCITNLDKNEEYQFKIKNNTLINNSKQTGGRNDQTSKVNEIMLLGDEDDGGDIDGPSQILLEKIADHDAKVNAQLISHDTQVKDVLGSIQTQIQNIPRQQIIQQLPPQLPKQKEVNPETENMEDLFEGVEPFDLSLKRLSAAQKMKNINNNEEDLCIIL